MSACRVETIDRPLVLVMARDISDHVNAQDVLDEFFRLAPDLFAIVDMETLRLLKFNDSWTSALGYSREELESLTGLFELIDPRDSTATAAARQQLWDESDLRDFVNRYRCQDGSLCWLSWRVTRKGRLAYSVARDITEGLHVEEALRRNAELFRNAFENAPIGMAIVGDPSIFIQVNRAFAEIVGYAPEELAGTDVMAITHPDDRELHVELVQDLKEGRVTSGRFEKRFLHKDGHVVWALNAISITHDEHGQPSYRIAHIQDISRGKLAEEALRRSEEQFRCAFEEASIGMALVTPEVTVLHANQALCDLLGYSRAELVGRPFQSFTHLDDREVHVDLVRRLYSGEVRSGHFEKRYLHKSGRVIWASVNVAMVHDDRGRPSHTIAQVLDITDRKQAEEDSRRACEAAEAANRAKSEFLANLSHEIRTPLTAIMGFTELIRSDPSLQGLSRERLEDLGAVIENGKLLARLFDDLLDLAKIESGRVTIRNGPCDIAQIVRDIVTMKRPRAEARGLVLTSAPDGPVPPLIESDGTRLRQVLINLVGNAIKYTSEGEVRIRYGVRNEPSRGPLLEVRVIDTGIGLAPEAISKSFEPFHRGGSPLVRASSGMGLGLTISRRLVDHLGGTIEVLSEPGRGSVFIMTIPTRFVAPAAGADPTPRPSSRASTHEPFRFDGRVLLAEDNDATRRICKIRLEQAGVELTLARNGQEALDAVQTAISSDRPYDVIVLDLQMPVLDGYEAVRQLRAHGYDRPIVALTAYAMKEDRDECLRLGFDAHVAKPIDWPALFQVLNTVRPQRRGPITRSETTNNCG